MHRAYGRGAISGLVGGRTGVSGIVSALGLREEGEKSAAGVWSD